MWIQQTESSHETGIEYTFRCSSELQVHSVGYKPGWPAQVTVAFCHFTSLIGIPPVALIIDTDFHAWGN